MCISEIKLDMEVWLSKNPTPDTAVGVVVCPVALGARPGAISTGVRMTTSKGEKIVIFIEPRYLTPVKGK